MASTAISGDSAEYRLEGSEILWIRCNGGLDIGIEFGVRGLEAIHIFPDLGR